MQIGPPNVVGPLEIGKFSYSRAWPAHRSLTHFLSAHGPTAATACPSCHPRPATAWPRLPTTAWSRMAIARPCSLRCLPLPTRAWPPLGPTCPLLGPTYQCLSATAQPRSLPCPPPPGPSYQCLSATAQPRSLPRPPPLGSAQSPAPLILSAHDFDLVRRRRQVRVHRQ
jgi:hypothetical protein